MVGEIKAVRPRGCFLASGPCLRSGESGVDRTKKSSLWKKNQHGGKAGFEPDGKPRATSFVSPACLSNTVVLAEGHRGAWQEGEEKDEHTTFRRHVVSPPLLCESGEMEEHPEQQ